MAGRSPTKKRSGKAKAEPRTTEKNTHAPTPPPPGSVSAMRQRKVDLWGPVKLGALLLCVAWPVRWVLDAGDPELGLGAAVRPWALLVFGVAWLLLGLVLRRHVSHPQERAAALGTLAAAGVWMQAVWWGWLDAWTLCWVLVVGLVIAVGVQALNTREWERGKVKADLDAWPRMMKGTPWADTFPIGAIEQLGPGVIRRRFKRKEHADTSVGDLMSPKARERYEERNHLEHGSIRVERAGKSVDEVVVTEVRNDPHAGREGVTWTGKVLRHIWDDLVVAYYEDGKAEIFTPWRRGVGPRHGLIAGVTGSGKSTLMRLLAMAIAPAEEAATVMIDCKSGQSFGQIAALFSWFIHEEDPALCTLESLVRLMRWRQDRAREWGWSGFWRPSVEHPVYFVFVDELARLIGVQAPSNAYRAKALSYLIQLVQEGRSTGFCLIGATQYPTVEAVGSSQFKSQIDWRVCFRMAEPEQDQHVLTKKGRGMDASDIDEDRNGTCYIQNGSKCRAVPARALNVPDGLDENGEPSDDVEDVVTPVLNDHWDRRTPIPDEEVAVLDELGDWSARTIYGPNGETWVQDPDADEPTDAPALEDGTTMADLDQRALTTWLDHELPGVPPHDCGQVPRAGDAVMGRCGACGQPYPDDVAEALRGIAMDARPQPPDEAPARPALRLVPTPKEPAMTAAAGTVPLSSIVGAHQPTDAERAADEAALNRQEQAYTDEDTPDARAAAWRLFLGAGREGLAPVDMYRHPTVQRSDSWGYKRIREWRDQGHLVQLEAGRHRVSDEHLRRAR